ncbi:flagellar biosynthesis anti-sigma factor FlgM [Desulfobacca acetoxidans]|jgi:anti-sigma28 factor (negative regulator of flagellin synthesis)|uniref:Anti-sigma-28 factor FlgM family protein n=1 Tax=Desulfobacca acetoxidans (strain ATCC 700848 / DSM 11109 / ASRB2) TaxID=880072 RepID=F2NGA4_DESAR|nr:flagellar biosynthesis anti-sigma factor FlgM [Desulfobacca acetoxidans]AEB08517.1 Anti-sigma-28 factor FlgM family protein [Desulfobacca acetoxidans DSM 11109]HAY22607.1 hypothetical protein [Desulfobacterales bacterium]
MKPEATAPPSSNEEQAAKKRAAKVAAIKEAVEKGAYHPDVDVLTDRLLCRLLEEQWEDLRLKKP